LTITGVTATDVITANLEVADVGMIMVGANGVGGAGGGGGFAIDVPQLHNQYIGTTVIVGGTFSPSGRYYYALSRWSTALSRIDTSNGDITQIQTAPSAPNASGTNLFIGADGFAYIANQYGRHHGSDANGIGVARVDLGSMTAIADTRVYPSAAGTPVSGQSAIAAYRGHRMAIAYGTSVYFFDTDTMSFVDTDAATDGIQGVDLAGAQIRRLAYSADGSVLYTNDKDSNDINMVDAAFTVSLYHTATTTGQLFTLDLTTGDVSRVTSMPTNDRLGHVASWLK
jgi:hypothetical protein